MESQEKKQVAIAIFSAISLLSVSAALITQIFGASHYLTILLLWIAIFFKNIECLIEKTE